MLLTCTVLKYLSYTFIIDSVFQQVCSSYVLYFSMYVFIFLTTCQGKCRISDHRAKMWLQTALCLCGLEQSLVVALWFLGSEQSPFVPRRVQVPSVTAASLLCTAVLPVWLCCSHSATTQLPASSTSSSIALFNWMFSLIKLLRHRLIWFDCVTQSVAVLPHRFFFFFCASVLTKFWISLSLSPCRFL